MSISDQAACPLPDQAYSLISDKTGPAHEGQRPAAEQTGGGAAAPMRRRSAKVAERLMSGGFTRCIHFDAASGQCEREGNCTFDHTTNSCKSG